MLVLVLVLLLVLVLMFPSSSSDGHENGVSSPSTSLYNAVAALAWLDRLRGEREWRVGEA
jgi:preprotein translocase subunit SecG